MRTNLFFIVAVAGCTTNSAPEPILDWRLLDLPETKRIELSLRNNTHKSICLTPDDWPNSAGKLNANGGEASLRIGEEVYPIRPFDTGYCPNGCWTKVAPGETIEGFFLYEDFDLPERLRFEPKILIFEPRATFCQK